MTDSADHGAARWSSSPTTKAKHAVQKCVTALLDELAPERVLKRMEQLPGQVQQHRTPTGCVLQAASCAVSVSWFADATDDSALGELHVIVWHGTVTRRGAPRPGKGATVVADLVLRPSEPVPDTCGWRATDGTEYDNASLAARCIELLDAQIARRG